MGMATGGLLGTGLGQGRPELVAFSRQRLHLRQLRRGARADRRRRPAALYAVFVERGLRTALGVRDGFGKLLAVGLAFSVALQVFVVVGGVTRVIPLTGLTIRSCRYGGSSLLANWALMAILLRICDQARRPVPDDLTPDGRQEPAADRRHRSGGDAVNAPLRRVSTVVALLFARAVHLDHADPGDRRAEVDQRPAGQPADAARQLLPPARARSSSATSRSRVSQPTPNEELKYLRSYPAAAALQPRHRLLLATPTARRRPRGRGRRAAVRVVDSQFFYTRVIDLLTGKQPVGASVQRRSTPRRSTPPTRRSGNQRGAVVALDPSTGAILAMVSHPQYDPNRLSSHDPAAVVKAWNELNADPTQPLRQPRDRRQPLPAGLHLQDRHGGRRAGVRQGRHRTPQIPAPGGHGPAPDDRRTAQLRPAALRPGQPDHAHARAGDLLQHGLRLARYASSARTRSRAQAAKFGFGDDVADADARSSRAASRGTERTADRAVGHRPVRRPGHAAADGHGQRRASPTAGVLMRAVPHQPRAQRRPADARQHQAGAARRGGAVRRRRPTSPRCSSRSSTRAPAPPPRSRRPGGRQDRAPPSRARASRRTPGSPRSPRPNDPKVAVAVVVEDGGDAGTRPPAGSSPHRSPKQSWRRCSTSDQAHETRAGMPSAAGTA